MSDRPAIDDDELLRLRHGDADGRARLAALAAGDAELRARLGEWDRQDAALHALYDPVADEPVPARLKDALATGAPTPRRLPRALMQMAAAILLIAGGAAGGWYAALQTRPSGPGLQLADGALRAYATYVVEVAHPVEVGAADEAHLVTWLSKRLGSSISPPDFASHGFHLMGGRVVPDANGAAALMMYEDDLGRRITLYAAPAPDGSETAFRFAQGDGAQGFWWIDDALGYAIVGDVSRDELRAIAVSAYDQLLPG